MRPPRLICLLFCFIFLPVFYTFFSALFSSPRVATPSALAGRSTGLHSLFSFNLPSSLFPPSAIISLTDDNSTFSLARPAAFGPSLPREGLSGQLWVGSGFGDGGLAVATEGELGCSDIPGWGDGSDAHYKNGKSTLNREKSSGKSGSNAANGRSVSQNHRLSDSQQDSVSQNTARDKVSPPSMSDGTDDHLHHPLPESDGIHIDAFGISGDYAPSRPGTHADVQSLQESAEIAGRIVLLSRGGCGFLEKVKWVQRRGGVAVIVGDDTKGGSLVTMYARGDTSNVTIPALFTSHTTAHLLSSLIPPQVAQQAGRVEESRASRTRISSYSTSSIPYADMIATPSASPTPTPTPSAIADVLSNGSWKPKTGFVHTLLSMIGLSSGNEQWHPPEDSRRPPSSGNIDWVLMDSWDQMEPSVDYGGSRRSGVSSDSQRYGSKMGGNIDGDGFVIGVQDWRDPDLAPSKRNALPSSSMAIEQKPAMQTRGTTSTPTSIQGGSVTPGSGEYVGVERNSYLRDSSAESTDYRNSVAGTRPASQASDKGWLSRHFGRANAEESNPDVHNKHQPRYSDKNTEDESHSRSRQSITSESREGLWVTLAPTSMSTSPFFDTLLVLVVSPLLTLSVVYALLLIRSHVRRRRWRAPKSLVERLPVRTYHTISTPSIASSPRPSIRDEDSPSVPLLACESSRDSRSKSPSPMASGSARDQRNPSSKGENSRSNSRLWRRRYTGRQVECVVCLEEYIDGHSRVMSLPCGHEFHAECM